MGLCSETFLCAECDHTWTDLIDRKDRDEFQYCKECGWFAAKRTFSVPNVSTSKTSQSIPEVASRGRFDHFREQQTLKKAKSEARRTGDRDTEKKVDAELKKVRKQ